MKTLKGVYTATKKDGTIYYRASITVRNKHISLGSFTNEDFAHKAYLEAALILDNKAITIDNFTTQALPFDKRISLLNFRDNLLYFPTPIYIYSHFFHYYYSPDLILTFDKEDLFYYATHKIMKRGGHYFVADYGMQVNILNRYGIKNYAVSGVDYQFINGDSTDFRYHNVKILSSYHGVKRIEKKGRFYYQSRILIKGSYIIGEFDQEIFAAIAYNKAVDILKQKGSPKKYPVNYIENLSPKEYANIYSDIRISSKIMDYPSYLKE